MLSASYIYSGYADYFCGHGCDDNEYLLYAYYGRHTTLACIIDQLVDDSNDREIPKEVTTNDVRSALLDMLSSAGLADYISGALAECSAAIDRLTECPDCEAELDGDTDYDCCPECGEWFDDGESPIFIVLLSYEE
jgi:hypothetical protein